MRTTVQADETGAIRVPGTLLPNGAPHALYHLESSDLNLIIVPETERSKPFWETATAEEKARAFIKWVEHLPAGPGLSDFAVNRESIYD